MHSHYRRKATLIKQLNIRNGGGIHGYDPGLSLLCVGERVVREEYCWGRGARP